MARIDLRIFSHNPPHDGSNTILGAILAVIGLYLTATSVASLVRAPWDLATTGVEIDGTPGERGLRGDQYVIEVDGTKHVCHRGQRKHPAESATILYDPADPSRCRAKDSIGGPSRTELVNLSFGLVFLLMGSAILMARYAEPRAEWERENPASLLRPWAMTVARALFIGATIAIMVMVWILWLALDAPSDETSPARRAKATAEAGPEASAPEAAPPPTTAIEPIALEVVLGVDWPLAKPTLRKIDVKGPSVWIGDPEGVGSRLVISSGKSYFGKGDTHRLVDVARGEVLATFDDEGIVSASAKVVVTRKDNVPTLVHTDDGSMVAPDIRLPRGRVATKFRIVASETDARVWLFAQIDDGTVYHGQWVDPRTPAIELHETMPEALKVWPRYATGANGIEVWNDDAWADPQTCIRLRFDVGATPRCLQRGAEQLGSPWGPFLAGPWKVVSSMEVEIENVETGARFSPMPDCMALEVTRLDAPPRLLATCTDDGDLLRRHALWSPEVTRTFSVKQPSSMINSGVRHEPVVAIEEIADSDVLVHWLDMESGRLFASPPVTTLVYGGSFGYARRILAQRVDDPKALWVIDLESGVMERIVRDIGCAEHLIHGDVVGTRAVIGCSREGAMAGTSAQLRGYRWTEVIDFAARKRWRTDGAFDGRIAQDGTVVAVTRKRPARLIGIDLK